MRRPELIDQGEPIWKEPPRQPVGLILVESIIDRRGRVCAARLRRGSGPTAEAFLQAMKRWKFKPATKNGKAVAVFYEVTVDF